MATPSITGIQRLAAVPCQSRDLLSAKSISSSERTEFFESDVGTVHRISIIALLVSWDGNTGVLDDATGNIMFKAEPKLFADLNLGSIIICTGKLRKAGSEQYISIETAKAIQNPSWLTYRKYETALFRESSPDTQTNTNANGKNIVKSQEAGENSIGKEPQAQEGKERASGNGIFEAIRLLDPGDGADIGLVVKKLNLADDSSIQKMIKAGDLYQIRPGKIKIL